VSYKTALSWLLGCLAFLLGVAFTAGASHFRINYLAEEQIHMREVMDGQDARGREVALKLAIIQNDVAWQVETTKLIAQKLDVSTPIK
jgi:hypothetical protein